MSLIIVYSDALALNTCITEVGGTFNRYYKPRNHILYKHGTCTTVAEDLYILPISILQH